MLKFSIVFTQLPQFFFKIMSMSQVLLKTIKCHQFLTPLAKNFSSLTITSHAKSLKISVTPISLFRRKFTSEGVQENISSLQVKKRLVRKKKPLEEEIKTPGLFNIAAYATSEEYNLEQLLEGLKQQDLYDPKFVENTSDVVIATAKYQVENEPREIFFFREGGVVFWNVNDMESENVLSFVRNYETDSYSKQLVKEESEIMTYKHQDNGKQSTIEKTGNFLLNTFQENTILDKYTFSNALVLSVKLGVWEASLEKYINSIEFVTEDLKKGRKISMSRQQALRKHGELFALRHLINLSSDLLDTPDFYWENDQLENLYLQICSYFCINKRTKVMNEKINHCVELIELLTTHLSDKHHIRLEWMIIILIMVEVAFETIHYIDRFVTDSQSNKVYTITSS